MDSIIPQKSISASACSSQTSSEGGLSQQISQEQFRCGYAPAAMIGIALSMGACGLLVPHKGDAAMAADKLIADSVSAESLATEPNKVPDAQVVPVSPFPTAARTEMASAVHVVQEGETLAKIAQSYGLSTAQLAQANSLSPAALLSVGQSVMVPVGAKPASEVRVATTERSAVVPVLGSNSSEAQVPTLPTSPVKLEQTDAVKKLKEQQSRLKKSLAELRSEESKVIASLPTSRPEDSVSPAPTTYQVEVGDTLSTIARAHGVSVSEIISLNKLADPNAVWVNQILKLPQAKVSASVSSAVAAQPNVPVVALNRDVPVLQKPVVVALPNLDRSLPAVSPAVQPAAEKVQPSSPQYVQGLLNEVQTLRQKYQSQQVVALRQRDYSVPTVVVPTVSMPASSEPRVVNPEFNNRVLSNPARSLPVRVERVVQAPTLPQPKLPPVVATPASRVIARAPIGTNGYPPLVQTTALRMTAPQMPNLGTSDNYIPQAKGSMKGYIWPAAGVFTSGYGWRWGRMHRGIDVAGPVGTPIVAAAAGVISYAGWNDGGYGYLVEVEHVDGSMTRYAHNHRILVSQGQRVSQGQQIAEMGSTGFSTGPHLHFEIHRPEGVVNPVAYLPNDRS